MYLYSIPMIPTTSARAPPIHLARTLPFPVFWQGWRGRTCRKAGRRRRDGHWSVRGAEPETEGGGRAEAGIIRLRAPGPWRMLLWVGVLAGSGLPVGWVLRS